MCSVSIFEIRRSKFALDMNIGPSQTVNLSSARRGLIIALDLVTAAGSAILRRLSSEPHLYTRLNAMGERFRSQINQFVQEEGYPAKATGAGSMFWMHATPGPINSARDAHRGDPAASTALRLLFRRNGLHISSHHGFMCTEHTDEDFTRLIEIHKASLQDLRSHGIL